jgi:hypothetical protein
MYMYSHAPKKITKNLISDIVLTVIRFLRLKGMIAKVWGHLFVVPYGFGAVSSLVRPPM